MSSILLILISVCSFLFYGVVGQDKAPMLAPAIICCLLVVSINLLHGAWRMEREAHSGLPVSNPRLPISSVFWLLFILWGVLMVPGALMTHEAKVRVLFLASVVGSYLVWGRELRAFKGNRIVLGWVIFIVTILGLYGLVVHFKSSDSLLWTQRYTDHYDGRLASTYICPNHFAHLMQMLLPFCIALLFIPQSGIYLKILAAYGFLAMLPPLFFSESRAGWLGSIAGVGTVICLMALRKSRKLFTGLIVLVPLCSILLLVGSWRYSETFQRRMAPVVEFLDGQAQEGVGSDSPDFRPQTWQDTLDMIEANPVVGYGPGSYRYAYPEFRKRFKGERILTGHPHNEYLELTAEFGVIGFGLFALAWIWGAIWVLIKSLRTEESRHAFMGFALLGTIAGTMVHSFFDFQMHVFPNAMVFALLAAMSVGALRRGASSGIRQKALGNRESNAVATAQRDVKAYQTPQKPKTLNLKLQTAYLWLVAVGFFLLALYSIPVLGSGVAHAFGDRALDGMNDQDARERAVKWYRNAEALSSDNWRAYRGEAKVIQYQRRHSLDLEEKYLLAMEEVALYGKALEHNPKDPESLIASGRALLFLALQDGDSSLRKLGVHHLKTACSYRKFNDEYWWLLGVELRKLGLYEDSLEAFRHMETIRRTKSSRKNIQWLEKRLDEEGSQRTEDGGLRTEDEEQRTEDGGRIHDVKSALDRLDEGESGGSGSLDDLFRLMEQ